MTPTGEFVHAARSPGVRARARQSPLLVIGAVLLVLILTAFLLTQRATDERALSVNNPGEDGAMAVAEILRDQGVTVDQVTRLADAAITDPSQTTVVIASAWALTPSQVDSILTYPGDVVVLGTPYELLDELDSGLTASVIDDPFVLRARCDDPDARAAGEIRVGSAVGGDPAPSATACFASPNSGWGFLRYPTEAGTVTLLAASQVVTNSELAEYGHAALSLRAIGAHPRAVWYVGDLDTTVLTWPGEDSPVQSETEVALSADFLPPGTMDAIFVLGLAVLVAAVWRARRFGPVVTEDLPVVVRGSEGTRGRARLYRRGRATEHAGATLRASAAVRMGARLGVPRSAGLDALVDATARATGRDSAAVRELLAGPPPRREPDLMTLAQELDTLESEVHAP